METNSIQPVCDVVLLSWNQVEMLEACVEQFLKYTDQPVRLMVVDNASEPKTKKYIQSLKSTAAVRIDPIFNSENLGFVGGMNVGLRASRAPIVCLLNNDTLVTPHWLSHILAVFNANPSIGILNPNSSTFGVWPKAAESVEAVAARLAVQHQAQPFMEIGTCIGFCMAIRRQVIEKIGHLETTLHKFFFEDTDYCKRAKQVGFLCGVAQQAYVFHYEHRSFKNKKHRDFYFKQNQRLFYEKWGKPKRIVWVIQKPISEKDRQEVLALARKDHFIYALGVEEHVALLRGLHGQIMVQPTVRPPSLFKILWRVFKRRKKPYDVIVMENENRICAWLLDLFCGELDRWFCISTPNRTDLRGATN